MIFKYCKSFILIIFVILKEARTKCEVCSEFIFKKEVLCYKAILINFVTRQICDTNLTSDNFVLVWKLRLWASVIMWEYI